MLAIPEGRCSLWRVLWASDDSCTDHRWSSSWCWSQYR